MSAYAKLEARFARLGDVQGAMAMLRWDGYVMMPPGAGEVRGEQLATLTALAHETLTDPALPDLAGEAEAETLDPWQRTNLRLINRRLREAAAIPGDLASALAKASMETELAWREARQANDYKMLLRLFAPLLALVREAAVARGEAFGLSPYDAALDSHQPALRDAHIAPIFDDLARTLPPLLDEVLARQASLPAPGPVPARVPVETQRRMCEALVAGAGFDFSHGRLDVAAHPFCGGVAGDIRLTTRYAEDDFLSSIMGVIHETGHALYEMGLPAAWRRQPVGEAAGMMLHESQSLIMEMQAGRSREFAAFLAREVEKASGQPCPARDLYRHMTKVERSFIRVEADEVTYPLHVILRTRLERALLAGDLAPADLPGAWNEGMKILLGIVPPTDTLGCLQDPHWYGGEFGYFPTYTLGAMLAAQLFRAATAQAPGIAAELEQGSFAGLQGWLRRNIHEKAMSLEPNGELLVAATGSVLDPELFRAHLRRRYLES